MATIRTADPPSALPLGKPITVNVPCGCCNEIRVSSTELVHDRTGMTLWACIRCLRSVVQMRVDQADERGSRIIRQSAEELGWHVWRANDILYLVPSVVPFVPGSSSRAP